MVQVFGDKAFEKLGKSFISMHFSDHYSGIHKKVLSFKFVLPGANNMADMARLVALVPYYIDLIGRYKLSSQVGEFALPYYYCRHHLLFMITYVQSLIDLTLILYRLGPRRRLPD